MAEQAEKTIKIVIDRCNVTKIYHAEKSGVDYLTITDGKNELNISSGDLNLKDIPTLVPLKIDAEVNAFVYKGGQMLKAISLKYVLL